MTWEHPAVLWFLILPVFGLVWTLVRPDRESENDPWPKITRLKSTMTGLRSTVSRAAIRTRPVFMYLAIILVIAALARPQWGQTEEQVYEQAREVLIALDLSRSMLVDDVSPSRLERSKLMIQSLLDYLDGERVGLIVFAGTAFLQSPLSGDYQVLRGFLPELDPDYLPQGGTNYDAMLETALSSFGEEASPADRFLIVLSDGESLDTDWKPGANDLRDRSIRVLGLGVGTSEGGLVPDGRGGYMKDGQGAVVLSRLNDATLLELSEITRGTYRNAAGWIDLGDLIEETIEKGRAGQFLEDRTVKRIERFQLFLLVALILAFLSLWRELPSLPRARRIQKSVVRKERKRISVSTAALPIAFLLVASTARAPAQSPIPPEPPDPEPLKEIVTEIMGKPEIEPADWAGLARETITYGQALQQAGQPVVGGSVVDGLDAVDRGESLDPEGADWKSLREELLKLLEEPPQQNQQQKDENQQEDQENQENQSENQQQPSEQQDQEQSQQDQQQNPSDPQSQNNQGDQQEEQERQSEPEQPSEQEQNEPQDQGQEQEAEPESQQEREMQKFGGDPSSAEELPEDPELAAAMQELEQVRNQDSPARLFQILEGEPQPDSKPGKNW
jgi:Ca-activated chloride channel family protein